MRLSHYIFAACFTMLSSSAMAIVDIQGQIGKRWGEFSNVAEDFTVNGMETVISAHINPIPLPIVSIGFGASMGITQWDTDDYKSQQGASSLSKAGNLDFGLEVMVSASIPFLAEPYAKLNYLLSSVHATEYKIDADGDGEDDSVALGLKGSGTSFSLGMKSSLLPLISLLLEYKMDNITYEYDEFKVAGTDLSEGLDDPKFKSNSFLLGVEVGF